MENYRSVVYGWDRRPMCYLPPDVTQDNSKADGCTIQHGPTVAHKSFFGCIVSYILEHQGHSPFWELS